VPDLFGLQPRRPGDDLVVARAAGLMPALEQLVEANLALRDGVLVESVDSVLRARRLAAVSRAWARALEVGWAVDELTGLGLDPPSAP